MSTSKSAPEDPVARLERCQQSLDAAQAEVDEYGEASLQELDDAYTEFREMLEIYQGKVTGDDGDIQTIVEFQSEIDRIMGGLSDDMLRSDLFEESDEYLQQKWFSDADFEHVYELLEPVADLTDRLETRDEALSAYRDARQELTFELRDAKKQREELERLADLTDADLDAPTERLREPIETYNDAVREAFREYKANESARTVVRFLQRMERYPLIEFESPPADLAEYTLSNPPGTEPIPTVLEYGNYSRSKLSHYVENPDKLKHAIEHHRAYFEQLDASPLVISWPPPPKSELRWRCRALTAAVNRIDPAVVEHLRAVAALSRETEYDRLRNSAVVREDLNDDERERLKSGAIETELDEIRATVERFETALDEYPDR